MKYSLIIVNDTIIFTNSLGDVTAVNTETGLITWQLPTQSNLIFEGAFSLETSEIITDGKILYFSNNKNEFKIMKKTSCPITTLVYFLAMV